MRRGDVKLFIRSPQLLYEMALLRQAGWSFESLASLYGCDRTSVRDQCRRYVILPQREVINPKRIVTKILVKVVPKPSVEWTLIDGERVCLGRNYADYFK